MAIKSTSKVNLLLSMVAIICGVLCLSYCITNLVPIFEIKESFIEIIRSMKGGVAE
ncbi:hypothetical protein [Bacillus sp. FJAT-22090]|uniref:hypothetical protein n=1 Tax=Bacillus sp. FJAT-22090 TaxID=1581038 RepID=UPI000B2AA66B|nr:hypothetical protein [Bacillus sp. FJAT-22090]